MSDEIRSGNGKRPQDEWDEDIDDMPETASEPEAATSNTTEALSHPSYTALEEQLTLAEQKAHENWEKAARATAELENIRRRTEREVEQAHRYALEKFARELLPVLDSLEQAGQLSAAHGDKAMAEGIELTMKLLTDACEKQGITCIDPIGMPFDPQIHEAMSMVSSSEVAPNSIMSVFQKGYLLNGRVIRPARVLVAKE